jgi:hypothetical protein
MVIGVFLIAGWILLNAFSIYESLGSFSIGTQVIGQGGVSGVIGLLVMAVFAGLLLFLYSELGETDPAPDPFPPENR